MKVDGRPVSYGLVDVDGPTIFFLHGWGISHHPYAAAVEALGRAGYRVIAPDLPGFGGSASVPAGLVSVDSFGRLLAGFLEAEGTSEPVAAVGHSFGGGVAVCLAAVAPERCRAVVMVDAVSSPTWSKTGETVRLLATRPLWDWAYHLALEVPVSSNPVPLLRLLGELAHNFVWHPATLGLAAHAARSTNLELQLKSVCRSGVPVAVLWADGDRVIPRDAFDDQCVCAGVEGVVVPGNHSWPMTEPARFADVVDKALAALDSPEPLAEAVSH